MYAEAKKLEIIESLLKVEDDAVLEEVAGVLSRKSDVTSGASQKIAAFSGIWTKAEADEINKIIEDGCEQINLENWK